MTHDKLPMGLKQLETVKAQRKLGHWMTYNDLYASHDDYSNLDPVKSFVNIDLDMKMLPFD